MKEDDASRLPCSLDFQNGERPLLLLSAPNSEIESLFWESIGKLSDPATVQGHAQRALSRRGRKVMLRSIIAAQKAGLPVSPLALAALKDLERDLEISETRSLIEKLWIEPNIKQGYSLLLEPLAEYDL